jgi:hypothetical protein
MGMMDFEQYLDHVNHPVKGQFLGMSPDVALLQPGNLRAAWMYLQWLVSGGVAGQSAPDNGSLVVAKEELKRDAQYTNNFCFTRGMEAMRWARQESGPKLMEDFAFLQTPEAVGNLPSPGSRWAGSSIEYYYGPEGDARRRAGE